MKTNENIPENWGRDHWSTFAYIETLAVENSGIAIPAPQRMRSHRKHMKYGNLSDGSEYPTLLKNGVIEHHDDWDCLEDMIRIGLLTSIGGHSSPAYSLTKEGREVANRLREHKSNGGNFKSFNM